MEVIRTGLKVAEVVFCPYTAQGILRELINIHGFPPLLRVSGDWCSSFAVNGPWPLAQRK